ncbi:hypothetical protein HCA06_13920 [Listeria welshimeri]|nr:hypothetical protein [Listeria welshimeri]
MTKMLLKNIITKFNLELDNQECEDAMNFIDNSVFKSDDNSVKYQRLISFFLMKHKLSQKDGFSPIHIHNGILSLNPYIGCTFGCKYCFLSDDESFFNAAYLNRRPIRILTDDEILDFLVKHDFFVKDITPLGLHMSSTEPFSLPIIDSTLNMLRKFDENKIKNPIIIVTKSPIEKDILAILNDFSSRLNILLFVTYNPNNREIEPVKKGNYKRKMWNMRDHFKDYPNISWGHFLRPVVNEWIEDENSILEVLEFGSISGVHVVGGLKKINGLDNRLSPKNTLYGEANIKYKYIQEDVICKIEKIHSQNNFKSKIVYDQSCGISYLLGKQEKYVGNIEGIKILEDRMINRGEIETNLKRKCFSQCSDEQVIACSKINQKLSIDNINYLNDLGMKNSYTVKNNILYIDSNAILDYIEKRGIEHVEFERIITTITKIPVVMKSREESDYQWNKRID